MRSLLVLVILVAVAASIAASVNSQPLPTPGVQLYTLNGGRLELKNMGDLCNTGKSGGKPGTLAVPCYLIHHGRDWQL